MDVYTYDSKPIIVKINGLINRATIADVIAEVEKNKDKLIEGDKIASERISAGYECKINMSKLSDITSWSLEDSQLCNWISQTEVELKKLNVKIIGDKKIPTDEMHWRIYFGNVR